MLETWKSTKETLRCQRNNYRKQLSQLGLGGRRKSNQNLDVQRSDPLELGLNPLRRRHCPAANSEWKKKKKMEARTSCCFQGNTDRNTKGTGRSTSSFFPPYAFQAPCSLMQPIVEHNRKPAGERHRLQSSSPSTTMQNTMVDLELRDNH